MCGLGQGAQRFYADTGTVVIEDVAIPIAGPGGDIAVRIYRPQRYRGTLPVPPPPAKLAEPPSRCRSPRTAG